MNEEEYRELFPRNKSFFSLYTLGKVLKWLIFGIIIFMLLLVAFRSWSMNGTGKVNSYVWTDAAVSLAAEKPDGISVYNIPEHNATTIDNTFVLSHIYYTEELKQFQFTLRYNQSAFKALKEQFTLSETPQNGAETFVFTLTDDLGNVYTSYSFLTDTRFVNHYFRLVFDGIDMTLVKTLTLKAYYKGNLTVAYDTLTLYEARYFKTQEVLTPKEGVHSLLTPVSVSLPAQPENDGQESLPVTEP